MDMRFSATFFGEQELIEPLAERIREAPDDPEGEGWLRVLLDLLEEAGHSWDGERNATSSKAVGPLRATKPEPIFGRDPWTPIRCTCGLTFRGSSSVGLLLTFVAEQVPGFTTVNLRMVNEAERISYEWTWKDGQITESRSSEWTP